MTAIQRLTDSCLIVTTGTDATLFDPGFHTFDSGEIDLGSIGDISRVLITHEHGDHVKPEFVRWLVDRRRDITVHSNAAVAALLAGHGVQVTTDDPPGVTSEDVQHEMIPSGQQPPNRSYTIEGVFTHPGDSYQPVRCAPVMALPLVTPWGSATQSVQFARRLAPRQVIPIHDHLLSRWGRRRIYDSVKQVLAPAGIELLTLDWGESATV